MDHTIMTPDDPNLHRKSYCWLCSCGLACCKVCGLAEGPLDEQPECKGGGHPRTLGDQPECLGAMMRT